MSNDDPRKNYWNESYYKYWKSRVDEAGIGTSQVIRGDANTEDDDVYRNIFAEYGFRPGTLLEVGCAWGRMFPLYLAHGLRVSGVDISTAMIEAARNNWPEHPQIDSIGESPAETLPFPDQVFDNLACIATLDATYQDQAVREFLRVTKPGARIFFTGKNDHYPADDQAAMDAEIGARGKNHPNFFTDVPLLVKLLREQGHQVDALLCFPRRGDFAKAAYVTEMPESFYEYMLVITRGPQVGEFPGIADAFSKTFREAEAAR